MSFLVGVTLQMNTTAPELKVMPQLYSKFTQNDQPPGTKVRVRAEQHWEVDFFVCDLNFHLFSDLLLTEFSPYSEIVIYFLLQNHTD